MAWPGRAAVRAAAAGRSSSCGRRRAAAQVRRWGARGAVSQSPLAVVGGTKGGTGTALRVPPAPGLPGGREGYTGPGSAAAAAEAARLSRGTAGLRVPPGAAAPPPRAAWDAGARPPGPRSSRRDLPGRAGSGPLRGCSGSTSCPGGWAGAAVLPRGCSVPALSKHLPRSQEGRGEPN